VEISRVPNNNFYYGCVEDYFNTFVSINGEHIKGLNIVLTFCSGTRRLAYWYLYTA
jgi:hypothetical protein